MKNTSHLRSRRSATLPCDHLRIEIKGIERAYSKETRTRIVRGVCQAQGCGKILLREEDREGNPVTKWL